MEILRQILQMVEEEKEMQKPRTHSHLRSKRMTFIDLICIILRSLSMRKTSSTFLCPFKTEKTEGKSAHTHRLTQTIDYISSLNRQQRSKRGKKLTIIVEIEPWN